MSFRIGLLVLALTFCCFDCAAQSTGPFAANPPAPAKSTAATESPANDPAMTVSTPSSAAENPGPDKSTTAETAATTETQFRVERMPLAGGAELITIFGRLDGMRVQGSPAPEVPLISVLRDTLSDTDPENDRLRYVWMLSYTHPNLLKRIASAIPFLYQHVGNQTRAANGPPKPILDLTNSSRQTWNRFFWMGMQNVFLDSYGIPLKASSRTYRRNASDYRSGHVMQALSILDNYEQLRLRSRNESELLALGPNPIANPLLGTDAAVVDVATPLLSAPPAFSPGEMLELRARLILSGKTFGGFIGPDKFHSTVIKRTTTAVDDIGHNWEMLRQRAEAEGLYFEPLTMPDGQATHALLWVAKSDLSAQANREFHDRFLNIANPWSDQRLRNWNGYSRIEYFDRDNRPAKATDPAARAVEMIPLALYGLDHPKIPALLIDFRDSLNPKGREMSRRVFRDVTKDIFSLSNFGNIPFFIGRNVYEFIADRRGIDLNQPSRLRSYSELKLLLSFNASLDPGFRSEIERRLQNVSVNPLNNDNKAELQLARQQYDALIDYANRPDGLAAKIERDRRAEMVALKHGATTRFFFNLANVLSFGRYIHREQATPELYERLELARRIEHHTQFLRQVAKSSPQTEVAWDMAMVKRSLQFIAERGAEANGSAARAAAEVFRRTNDAEARRLCLDALYKINNKTARNELLRVYKQERAQSEWRAEIADRLRKAVAEDGRIKPAEAKSVLSMVGQP